MTKPIISLETMIESLYNLDRQELRLLAYEALLISDGPDHVEGDVDRAAIRVVPQDEGARGHVFTIVPAPKTTSDTHVEHVGEGYSVTVQHCEHRDQDNRVCNEYLGVNYPSLYCTRHEASPLDEPEERGAYLRPDERPEQ